MKQLKITGWITVSVLLISTSCQKDEFEQMKTVEGKYVGTLSNTNGLKSAIGVADGEHGATADVTDAGNGQLMVHCYGGDLDTTFMLNYFENHDSLMVCSEEENFNAMYGHKNSGGMMGGHMNNNGWQNHMNNSHRPSDEHYGGFDMNRRTFGYTFKMTNGDLLFQGRKQ